MINIPNYREFYQKALIPMNDYDKQQFCKEFCGDCDNCIKANHWLVALEGIAQESSGEKEKYKWVVVVYPAKESGVFWSLRGPYYKTANPQTIDQAIEESRLIVKKLVESNLTAKTMMVS